MTTARVALDTYLSDKGIAFDDDVTTVVLTGTLNPLQLSELADVCALNAYGVWVIDGITCCVQDSLDDGDVDTTPT